MNNRIKILLVAGARPNFMKIAPIYHELNRHKRFVTLVVHTGQHYDQDMSDVFFRDLGLPRPDIHLGVGSASHAVQTARIMEAFEAVCIQEKPDLVMVVGDVNSTIACALTAVKLGIKVAHVEAGLRSFDRTMPEEINRLLTDQISDYLFTTCRDADINLVKEGISRKKIFFVGNVMIDSLMRMITVIKSKKITAIKNNELEEIKKGNYALVTLHRPSNVDNRSIFIDIVKALSIIARHVPVIFPAHPKTRKCIDKYKMMGLFDCSDKKADYSDKKKRKINLTPPLGYLEFLDLMANASLVLTDSGGIQEETTILGVPCLTLRRNTERPITIKEGTNKLVGTDPKKIVEESLKIIHPHLSPPPSRGRKEVRGYRKKSKRPKRPIFWDGKASQRIVKILLQT